MTVVHPRRIRRPIRLVLGLALAVGTIVAMPGSAQAALSGASSQLTRAPYLTDLTASSVQVTWATTTQNRGVVTYGPAGSCSASSATSATLGNPITVNGITEYNNSVRLTGLPAATTFCYRISTGGTSPVDLLGSNPSPTFTTLDPAAGTSPLTFAVLGDWGDTTNGASNTGATNTNQAGVMAQIAASGARFAVSVGDLGYPGGSQTNYGDLNQTGVNISGVFAPQYWAVPGMSIPAFVISGNHGQTSTSLNNWPSAAVTAASGGTYAMVSYPSIDGTTPGSYPTSYYAFTVDGVRLYMLDAAWGNSNVGTATGGTCGSHCAIYQVDHDAHWTSTSAQYQWLKTDLAAHPGGVKLAFFHFPLRSDDATEPDDLYLQNTPGSSGSLEQLLADNGVKLVFNGHAHIYQRNVAPPGGVTSVVTGGGGAQTIPVGGHGCAATDAYAIGWSYSKGKGSACGAAPLPTRDSQIYHFLKVTVSGTVVSVVPTDSTGATFDPITYDLSPDSIPPGPPAGVTAARPSSTSVALTWSAATDNVGVSAYDVYRNTVYLATVPPTVGSYTDATITSGATYTYKVVARDLAGNTAAATVLSQGSGGSDTTPPTAVSGLTATVNGTTSVSLSWTASTDNVGVTKYTVTRNGAPVASLAGSTTSWTDTGLTAGTTYTYTVSAADAAGNVSAPSSPVQATTAGDTTPPTAPGTPSLSGVTSSQVTLSWAASTDDVGVVRYDVLRNGAVIASASGTTFSDSSVSPATAYTYAVRAYDAAGNSSTSGAVSVTTPASGSLFYDGFETGDMSQWTTVSGLSAQPNVVHTGGWAARQTSTGTATYAYKTLSSSATELWAQTWVYVSSRATSANLIGFRSSTGASIVNAYLNDSGKVSLRNNVASVTTYGGTTIANGSWHRLVLHASVSGTSSTLDVSLDGVAVPGLTLTGQNLGTAPIARLQLGETSTGRTYDIALDDVTVSPSPL